MKKMTLIFMAALLAVTIAIVASCKTPTPLTDALGNTMSTTDIQTYGLVVGEAGYYVFKFYENNPKYSEQVARCKQYYAALERAKNENGHDGIDLAAVNDATCEIITLAATAKLGPANGALVGAGARAALLLGYQFYKSHMKESQLEIYLDAVWKGIENAKANGADLIAQPTDIDTLVAMQPSDECGHLCIVDKIKSRLAAGNLSDTDKVRLEKRLAELEAEIKAIEDEVNAERAKAKTKAAIEKKMAAEGVK